MTRPDKCGGRLYKNKNTSMFKCSPKTRNKLSEIVSPKTGSRWWDPDLFEKEIRHILPKEIEILEPPPKKIKQYNCFVFALGLHKDDRFLGKDSGSLYQLSFFPKLIDKHYLIQKDRPEAGDIILYKTDEGVVTHAGVIESPDIVISKWSWGPLVRHHIFCVPAHYGDNVSYYKKPNRESLRKILDLILEEQI